MVDEPVTAMLRANETRLMGVVFCTYLAASVLKNLRYMHTSYKIHHDLWQTGHCVLATGMHIPTVPVSILPVAMAAFAASLILYASTANQLPGVVALGLYLWIFPSILPLNLVHQKSNNCAIVLSILLLSREYHSPLFTLSAVSAAQPVAWPLVWIRTLLAAIYMANALHKLMASGWRWTTGKALQWYLLEHYLWGGFRHAVPLMRNMVALRIASTVTVLTQLCAPLIVLGGWIPAVHGVFAVGFHLSTQIFMGIYFLTFFGPAMVASAISYPLARLAAAWLPVDAVQAHLGPLPTEPVESATWQILLMATLPAIQVWSEFSKKIRFPFGAYRLFGKDNSAFKDPGVLLIELGDESGGYRPWRPFEYYDTRNLSYLGYDTRTRTSGLSPDFDSRFKDFYWPVIRREHGCSSGEIPSIRLTLRYPVWNGDVPIGYDDYAVGYVRVDGAVVHAAERTPPAHLRSHRF